MIYVICSCLCVCVGAVSRAWYISPQLYIPTGWRVLERLQMRGALVTNLFLLMMNLDSVPQLVWISVLLRDSFQPFWLFFGFMPPGVCSSLIEKKLHFLHKPKPQPASFFERQIAHLVGWSSPALPANLSSLSYLVELESTIGEGISVVIPSCSFCLHYSPKERPLWCYFDKLDSIIEQCFQDE